MTRVTGPASGPDERYLNTRDAVTMLAQASQGIAMADLDDFVERSERSLAIGPLLHPTAYRLSAPNLEQLVTLVKAAREFRTVVDHLIAASVVTPPPERDESTWPPHLRSDAPWFRCDTCGRQSVAVDRGDPCGFPTPDGPRCPGRFGEPRVPRAAA